MLHYSKRKEGCTWIKHDRSDSGGSAISLTDILTASDTRFHKVTDAFAIFRDHFTLCTLTSLWPWHHYRVDYMSGVTSNEGYLTAAIHLPRSTAVYLDANLCEQHLENLVDLLFPSSKENVNDIIQFVRTIFFDSPPIQSFSCFFSVERGRRLMEMGPLFYPRSRKRFSGQ